MPQMSATEVESLAAGTVWIDAKIFSGKPDLARIARDPGRGSPRRSRPSSKAGRRGPAAWSTDWEVERTRQVPPEVLAFLREKGFFASPYEGIRRQGVSALACSEVFGKLTTRRPACPLRRDPHSVGPAELLAHYGTPEQKSTTCHLWRAVRKSLLRPHRAGGGLRRGLAKAHASSFAAPTGGPSCA